MQVSISVTILKDNLKKNIMFLILQFMEKLYIINV